jgi:hypothetical protein
MFEGSRAQARQAAPVRELRWVGSQHLMHGYCGRASEDGGAEVTAAGPAGGARAYAVRPMALLQARRNLVVRIGPRAAAADADRVRATGSDNGIGETQARAA